jgi:hypothetical protein
MKVNYLLRFLLRAVVLFSLAFNSYGMTTYLDVDCGAWVERKDAKKVQYEAYVVGLLTGMNGMWPATTMYQQNKKKYKEDFLSGVTNANQLFLAMDKFCRENPFKNVLEGSYSTLLLLNTK